MKECPAGHQRTIDAARGWSACVPADWSRRERGSEVVWSPGPGLDLVFSFQVKVVDPRDISAPLVAFLEGRGARVHQAPTGPLKYTLNDVEGVGMVKQLHRFGMLTYSWCDAPGQPCKDLVRTVLAASRSVAFDPGPEAPGYGQWETRRMKGVVVRAPAGSPAAGELDWLGTVYAEAHARLLGTLGVTAADEELRCYFYRSKEELFRYTRQPAGFNIPGGAGEVHSLFASRADRQSTGHEMTHAITRRAWGEPAEALLGEGIAVAMDLSGIDHHARAARAVTTLEPAFRLTSLLGATWWKHDPELSYGVSGSVVNLLLAEGGIAKVKALYRAKDLPAALQERYGWSLNELETRWRKAVGLD